MGTGALIKNAPITKVLSASPRHSPGHSPGHIPMLYLGIVWPMTPGGQRVVVSPFPATIVAFHGGWGERQASNGATDIDSPYSTPRRASRGLYVISSADAGLAAEAYQLDLLPNASVSLRRGIGSSQCKGCGSITSGDAGTRLDCQRGRVVQQ